ncbi:MAG: hypothetical protein OQK35_03820, partial [Alphaproteobacteria bacterium]|nr:hypothetical protein [Alphaproteobacteria bacterium]
MAEQENDKVETPEIDDSVFDELTVLQEGLDGGLADQDGPIEHSAETEGGVEGDPNILSSIQMGNRDSETGAATNLANASNAEAKEEDKFGFGDDEKTADEEIDSLDHKTADDSELGERDPGEVGGRSGQGITSEKSEKNNETDDEETVHNQPDIQTLGGEEGVEEIVGGEGEDNLDTDQTPSQPSAASGNDFEDNTSGQEEVVVEEDPKDIDLVPDPTPISAPNNGDEEAAIAADTAEAAEQAAAEAAEQAAAEATEQAAAEATEQAAAEATEQAAAEAAEQAAAEAAEQ